MIVCDYPCHDTTSTDPSIYDGTKSITSDWVDINDVTAIGYTGIAYIYIHAENDEPEVVIEKVSHFWETPPLVISISKFPINKYRYPRWGKARAPPGITVDNWKYMGAL